jgi:hypothetical protein
MTRLTFLAPAIIERIVEGPHFDDWGVSGETTPAVRAYRSVSFDQWRPAAQLAGARKTYWDSQLPSDPLRGRENTLSGPFRCFRFRIDHIDEFLHLYDRRSPPPKWAMERKTEKRAIPARESVSPVPSNYEYSRIGAVLSHVLR